MADYSPIKRLGAGHFGEVWLAENVALDKEVALKLIPSDKVLDPSNFFREAQTLQHTSHPNIVKVLDSGTLNDGRIYVSMEFLRRGSLEDKLKGQYHELSKARRVMIDVLRGLQWAHSKDIIHRDIKPGNILLSEQRDGILSDFGLALPANTTLQSLGVKEYAYFTHLAPEALTKKVYTKLTDIYAAGVTLYRLVNGDEYFPNLNALDIIDGIRNGTYPDRQRYRDFIPLAFRKVINKAMSTLPSHRYQSAEEMRHALESLTVCMNWIERKLTDGVEWKGMWEDRCCCVRKQAKDGKTWDVTLLRGSSNAKLRAVKKHCAYGVAISKADSHARRILQSIVLGKL